MLKKLENQPFMIVRKMQKAFPDNWFRYVNHNGNLCVLYIASNWDELLTVPDEVMISEGYKDWGDVPGINLIPKESIEIGGLEIKDWFN